MKVRFFLGAPKVHTPASVPGMMINLATKAAPTRSWSKVTRFNSSDENVAKFVFENDSAVAEAVLYKYPTYSDRTVICCSTQSGCPVGCRFCGTGNYFVRSLNAEEIVEQPLALLDATGVDPASINKLQIMFMSMGEPLLNVHHLEDALYRLYESFPHAALLISTSAPDVNYEPVRDFSRRIPTVGLQFSVHESTDEARDALIPFNRKLDLTGIAREGEAWFAATGRQPFFNYCVHDRNNTVGDADRLAGLFDPTVWQATISVVCEADESVAAANERQRQLASDFMGLMLQRGFSTRMFDPAGQDDIGGGCGQLWRVQEWMANNPAMAKRSAGSGLPRMHAPKVA